MASYMVKISIMSEHIMLIYRYLILFSGTCIISEW